ncbi:MAG: hypothetical protein GAK30_02722 [Paracidovorax wautersii]|uniref:DUF2946 family protein n=1 Tax=Paracidovorax wautersii TaxID=1177982 RepID=A0A7V8FMH9_9BURK|nr:MAG: hypothetical protein GAK30_02722 [Paracidovorax wautersii]
MDDIVKQAMAKWPNVPDCFAWLGLDARGGWYMRDDRVQAAGAFPAAKGSLLRHEKLIAFIARNYAADAQGRWFFQNGPQRVFVELESTPWVWRLQAQPDAATPYITSHTGIVTQASACLADEHGHVYLVTPLGLGRVHSQDMAVLADLLDAGVWTITEVDSADLPQRYGFVRSPAAPASISPHGEAPEEAPKCQGPAGGK